MGEEIPVAEALAVLQVRALDLEAEITVHALELGPIEQQAKKDDAEAGQAPLTW